MFSRHLIRLASASLLLAFVPARGDESNLWPFFVRHTDPTTGTATAEGLGPLLFARARPGEEQQGLRPVYMTTRTAEVTEGNILYPFFTWRQQADYRTFSFFQLVNTRADTTDAAHPDHRFDVWPFYFSRQTDDPALNYRALFPLVGEIRQRFGRDRLSFVVFPLYLQTEKGGRQVTHAPWPFLRFIAGDGHTGFGFWPLYGQSARAGDYEHRFWLWPLGFKSVTNLADPEPEVKLGLLPFYSRDTGPGYIRENYAWPFFGYTHRTAPYRYDERRYLWPLLVQGRGDDRVVNRWAPLYTHSVIKGTDKTWLLWPLYRHQRWDADGVAQEKNQVLFFLWWSLEQRSLAHPAAAPAHKTHLWPLFSSWDNGAGQRQVQALSPLEVFFPGNPTVRQLWTPLFALYRYDRKSADTVRHALLWNAVTWQRTATTREFHLGPLASVQTDTRQQRLALGSGLIGLRRKPGERTWRLFLFDFPTAAASKADQATTP
ncbi:hypothetical protein Verru16b_00835 [Lacunisphaera limnophila]|uniref:Uncharacterized protein n=1 Tax=Lacunisphaera limnophila TaxID=1838286 RepID=A0A1D8ASB0_9BACT|nr:hypothetical protein [Lacunisphaera limnophila]AOS43777.1 hypothetical protein Verru16b_00835 [Lacunisphaera limnophila]